MFQVFALLLLVVTLFLSESLLIFLFYVKESSKTQLITALSVLGVIFLQFERILPLTYIGGNLSEEGLSFCSTHIPRKLSRSIFIFLIEFNSFSVLLLSSFNHCSLLCALFLVVFCLIYMEFYQLTFLLLGLSTETLRYIIKTG